MANIVGNIIDDIQFRIGDPTGTTFRRPVVLRALNRVYKRYNERNPGLVTRETTFTFTDLDISSSINYKDLPADWLKPYRMTPKFFYREKGVFLNDEDYTYTIDQDGASRQIYFASVLAGDIVVRYYSTGYVLVDVADVSVGAGETNTPEWPVLIDEALIKAVCIELSVNYPMLPADLNDMRRLDSVIYRISSDKQSTDPSLMGPNRMNDYITDYQTQQG
jgi:hypothetical protein